MTSTYCITCINPALFIDNGACVPVCSGNLIPVNSLCTACVGVCVTCVGQINNCLRCQTGLFFVSNGTLPNCVGTCTTGYLLDNSLTSNRECLPACPARHFHTGLGTPCTACSPGCTLCSLLPSTCSLC